jgi:hypothetical protein
MLWGDDRQIHEVGANLCRLDILHCTSLYHNEAAAYHQRSWLWVVVLFVGHPVSAAVILE